MTTPTRRIRRSAESGRRAEMITAASQVIARDGIAAATTRRIADQAGVPPGLVHYWFSNKDELLEAVISDTLGPIESAVAAGAAADEQAGASMQARMKAALDVMKNDDRGRQIAMYEMTTYALRDETLEPVARRQYDTYRRVATESVSAWSEDAHVDLPADRDVVGQFVAALVDGLMLAWLVNPTTDVDGVLALVGRLMDTAQPADNPE